MRIIAGEARGRMIQAPAGRQTRPTLDRVRENLFNMLQTRIPDAAVLDLFSGSGALALEALSRGAATAVMADHSREAIRIENENTKRLGFSSRADIHSGDWRNVLKALKQAHARFDLVFLDPPYAFKDLRVIFDELEELLNPGAWIIVEHEGKSNVITPEHFTCIKSRKWGYCGISIYEALNPISSAKMEESE